jgi:hypothetical protein
MAFLFEITENVAYPNAETLLVQPFKEIWERDASKNKTYALEEFAYMEFMTSMKKSNPYRQYDELRKERVVREAVITQENWNPDGFIEDGMNAIRKFQTDASTTYSYYLAAKMAAEGMKDFFMTPGLLLQTNPKSLNPIYKPRDITSALNDTEKVLSNLKALEKKVEEELYEETKNRADKQISPFADPNSLKR